MLKKYKFESWTVAIRKHFNEIEKNSMPFIPIPNQTLFWAADPFIIHEGDKYYVFAELYNRLLYKGKIGYCIINERGKVIQKWKTALKSKGHLSFPFIFKNAIGQYEMMPETSQEKRISIYTSVRFPDKWEYKNDILSEKRFADSVFLSDKVLLTYDNLSRPRKLLKYSKQNDSWQLDQMIEDPEIKLRPGGAAYYVNDKCFLPIQDSENGEYGRKLRIVQVPNNNNLTTIADTELFWFTPETIKVHGENKTITGIHTYNYDGEFEVIDYKTYSSNLLSMIGYGIKKTMRGIINEERGNRNGGVQ